MDIAGPLCHLVCDSPDVKAPLIVTFSHNFFLSLINQHFKLKKDNTSEFTESKLWVEIKENLERDLNKRDKITIPSIALSSHDSLYSYEVRTFN